MLCHFLLSLVSDEKSSHSNWFSPIGEKKKVSSFFPLFNYAVSWHGFIWVYFARGLTTSWTFRFLLLAIWGSFQSFFFFLSTFSFPLFSFQDSKRECDLCLELHRILRLYLISFQSISHLLFTRSSIVLSRGSLTLFCALRIMMLSPPIIIMIILVISFFSSKIFICFFFGSIY